MAAEEADGYLRPVLEVRPTLSRDVEQTRAQHSRIAQELDGIFDRLCAVTPEQFASMDNTFQRINDLLSVIRQHHRHEEHLVMYAFNQDIGGQA